MAIFILIANIVTAFVISSKYHLSVARFFDPYYVKYFYKKPWIRIGAYQIGILFGMLYYEWKNRNRNDENNRFIGISLFYKVKHSKIVRYLLFIIGVVLFLFWIYIPQIEIKNKIIHEDSVTFENYIPQGINNIFNAIARPLFVTAIAMIVIGSLTGHNSFITFILGSKGYVPFARMTYMAYIVHLTIFEFYYNQQRQATYLHHKSVSWVIFAWIFVTFLISVPISMCFEMPFVQIEKLLMFPETSETSKILIEEAAQRNMTIEKSFNETHAGNLKYFELNYYFYSYW